MTPIRSGTRAGRRPGELIILFLQPLGLVVAAIAMRTSCLINNYNYGQFVVEAVESVLAQTVPFDEVIVVDDGSTDDSCARLEPYAQRERITLIAKRNEGQLSCFNAGFAASTGDVICFLDADDVYEPEYLEALLEIYRAHAACDYVFSALSQYHDRSLISSLGEDRDFGYSVILTMCLRTWIGAPTSCLSLRRSLLNRILPIPHLDDWRTRADDCLVFGASLMGGRKYYLSQPLVRYRVHESNQFARTKRDQLSNYRRKLAVNRLFDLLIRRSGFNADTLPEFAHREFQTLPSPTFQQWYQYSQIPLRSRVRWARKLALIASMAGYFFFGTQR